MRSSITIVLICLMLGFCALALGEDTTAEPPKAAEPAATTATPTQEAPFATPADGTTPTKTPSGKPNPQSLVSMSFDKADINDVIKFLSMATEIPIVYDADIKGQVTIVNLKQVPLSMAFEVVNSAIRAKGYTMVGTLNSKIIRVVPLKKAIADRQDVRFGADLADIPDSDDVITQIIPLKNVNVIKLRDELKSMVADDQASLIAISSTNSLVVTDTAGNVRRIMQVVDQLDKINTAEVIKVKVYPCKYSSAEALLDSLGKVFELKTGTTVQRPGQPPQGGQPGRPQIALGTDLISMKGEIRIAADARTNSLVISAADEKINLVLSVIEQLDIDTTSEVKARVFQLEYADANMVADQLNKLFEQPQGGSGGGNPFGWGGGAQQSARTAYAGMKRNVVVADIRTNSVIITATDQNMRSFEDMIKNLDTKKVLSEVTRVYPLKYAKAGDLARTMTSLFRGSSGRTSWFDFVLSSSRSQDGDPLAKLRNITVVAEERTNTLLVTGSPQSFALVENMITQLDQRGVQVFIQVAIVDVTLDDTTKFGVEWTWNSDHKLADGKPERSVGTNFGLASQTTGLKYSVISDNLQSLLHALETRSNVKVYSTPSITTTDNVQAQISIGRDEPFVTSEEETSGGNFRRSVDFKNVAISLTVTPHVNISSDLIALDINQTIDEIIERETELNAPIIANRVAKTSVMVNNGQTIVIGGIIKDNKSRVTKGVPFLSSIPILGEAFKYRTNETTRSELMVFLTPHILKETGDVNKVTQQENNQLSTPLKTETEGDTTRVIPPTINDKENAPAKGK
ncbi:MAG: secretin N-terminal domain-containing protein [Armatimonadota bacterium]